jgi:hypothetical protein
MARNTAVCAALASLLFVTRFLYGCAGVPANSPGSRGNREAEASNATGPICAHHSYGEVKNGAVEKSRAPGVGSAATETIESDAGKILVQSQPLDPLPPEIARIQRGVVKRFVGKFVNDGQTSWSGVDLDRLLGVTVERRVFDMSAHQPRPVSDPRFSQRGDQSFARKWSEAGRTEVEVISTFAIDPAEAQVFVCAANPEWADKNPLPDDDSDQLAQGATDYFLLDHRQEQGNSYGYTKAVALEEPLAIVLGQIWIRAPGAAVW